MKVVYIAGPYRGPTHWAIEQNVRRAEAFALEVWKAGGAAICPHANTRFFQLELPDQRWLDGDLEILRRCDAIAVLHGWETSEGTRAEKTLARACGLPIFYEKDKAALFTWLATR